VREWIGLAVLALPTLLIALDIGVLFLALPHLSADLGASATQQLWITDIYGFMLAGFLVTMGTLGDRIGRRRLLLIGAAGFGAASVAAAFSRSPGMLIAALGPVVGGLLLERFWWGSVFLLGVPVMVVLLAVGLVLLPEYRDANAGRLDPISVTLSLAAILPIVYGIKELSVHGVQMPTAATAAIFAGVAVGVLFVGRQLHLADPLLDLSLFGDRSFTVVLSAMMLATAALAGTSLLTGEVLQ